MRTTKRWKWPCAQVGLQSLANVRRLVPAVESLKVGDPADGEDIEMGPMITREQQDRVLGFLDRAEGATVLTGGGTGSGNGGGERGFFVRPTLITDVRQTDEFCDFPDLGLVEVRRVRPDRAGRAEPFKKLRPAAFARPALRRRELRDPNRSCGLF